MASKDSFKENHPKTKTDPASFRDNRGFVFWEGGKVFRRITPAGKDSYDGLMATGLYDTLVEKGLLIEHIEVAKTPVGAYKLIQPNLIPFVSYPYEWSFSQLKDAALATLQIQKLALAKDQTLRDASAYNIQFIDGKAYLIDTLSFEDYKAGDPWQAYRQFCQHFLAPLALMSYVDPGLLQLMRVYIDGIPLSLASKLLPGRSLFSAGLYMHVKLHGRMQTRHADDAAKPTATQARRVSRTAMLGLIDSLERTINGLKLVKGKTQWGDYYNDTNYSPSAFAAKEDFVKATLAKLKPKRVIDLGANDGTFSRLAAGAELIISADVDPLAVEHNYRQVQRDHETKLLPLLIDLTNPSPALGWANQERSSLLGRLRGDVVMALALIHHLAIANNLPLEMVAACFAELAPTLIIEFVPKSDSQVRRLLVTREDIFDNYTEDGFEKAFAEHYSITNKVKLKDSDRIMYLMSTSRGR